MRIYAISIKPLSPFGNPLKGDTIFGQFCWLAAENEGILPQGLPHWIDCYRQRPFAVFSSAWPKIPGSDRLRYAVRRPELPLSFLGDPEGADNCSQRLINRKARKNRKWLLLNDNLQAELSWDKMVDDVGLYGLISTSLPATEQRRLRMAPTHHRRPISTAEQQHNTINRLTMTTGKGEFAPYTTDNLHYMPGMELVVFVGLEAEAGDGETLERAFTLLGNWGFGRDASTGLGRFALTGVDEITLPSRGDADACLTLGPSVPEKGSCRAIYCAPFVRFGRHGAQILHAGKPFKNPVVMADEGAVVVPNQFPEHPYIGRAVGNISKAQPEAVCQGYSLYLPISMPDQAKGGSHD